MTNARIPSQEIIHINMDDPRAVNYYCDYLNCTKAELEEAIQKIGNCLGEVEIYLRQDRSAPGSKSLWDNIKSENL